MWQRFHSSHIKCNGTVSVLHDHVIKWKRFLHYWPFVRGIHRSPVNSPQKCQWRGALMFSLICAWINGWVNNGWWFETPWRPLWHHCNSMTWSKSNRRHTINVSCGMHSVRFAPMVWFMTVYHGILSVGSPQNLSHLWLILWRDIKNPAH